MDKERFLSRLAFYASFFALSVIALGAFTRLIDAGLGCPDWPGCYGHLAAPLSTSMQPNFPTSLVVVYKGWAEMVHRYFVGGLSCFILAVVATIFSQKSLRNKGNVFLACVLLGLLSYQILLGALTVTLKLLPIIVTQHLLGGFLILSTLWLISLKNKRSLIEKLPPQALGLLLPMACVGLILLFLQLFLGAWTSTNYASLSCADFPFCSNTTAMTWQLKEAFRLITPVGINYEGGVLSEAVRQTIQMMHRLGALVVTGYLFVLVMIGLPRLQKSVELMKSLYLLLGLLLLQVSLGISNVIFKLPLVTALSHSLVAAMLLLTMITLIFKLYLVNVRSVK